MTKQWQGVAFVAILAVLGSSGSVAGQATSEDELEALKRRVAELEERSDGSYLSKLGSMFKVYGFLRLDMIYDDSEPNDNQVPSFIQSEDRTFGQKENDDSFTIHGRLTRFGLAFDGPDIRDTGLDLTGRFEIDFYGLPASDSRNFIRMRLAYMNLAAANWFVRIGQDWDLFSPLNPAVNADLVMWNAGNLGDRRPQLRVGFTPKVGDMDLSLAGALGLTGAVDAKDDAAPFADGVTAGEDSGLPQLSLRVGVGVPLRDDRKLEVGLWAVRAWEQTDVRINGTNDFDSHVVGVDVMIPVTERLWVKGEAWFGKNLSDLRGGIGQGINTVNGDEIKAHGWWGEIGFKLLDYQTYYVGYSTDNPHHNDLPFGGRDHNQVFYVATKNTYLDPVTIGFEYLHWETEFAGLHEGDDNRFKVYFQYNF